MLFFFCVRVFWARNSKRQLQHNVKIIRCHSIVCHCLEIPIHLSIINRSAILFNLERLWFSINCLRKCICAPSLVILLFLEIIFIYSLKKLYISTICIDHIHPSLPSSCPTRAYHPIYLLTSCSSLQILFTYAFIFNPLSLISVHKPGVILWSMENLPSAIPLKQRSSPNLCGFPSLLNVGIF